MYNMYEAQYDKQTNVHTIFYETAYTLDAGGYLNRHEQRLSPGP